MKAPVHSLIAAGRVQSAPGFDAYFQTIVVLLHEQSYLSTTKNAAEFI